MRRIRVVDSHTAGEPTRVVIEGGPDLGGGSLAQRRERFRAEHDLWRSALVNEPRGSEVMVGALLCEPTDPACTAAVIYFNNVGYLGMCGHGTLGVIATLAHLGRIRAGLHRLETPVGTVAARLEGDGRATVFNVPSYRWAANVTVEVPGHGAVRGDVAWGGNWFFLVEEHGLPIAPQHVEALTDFSWKLRLALAEAGVTGEGGAEIDHVELAAASPVAGRHSRNFVLCPGKAYDRSPCGTGTSAKLACLAADGKLAPGEPWLQESVIGSLFEGRYSRQASRPDRVLPEITGEAFVTGEATLLLDDRDPLRWGIR